MQKVLDDLRAVGYQENSAALFRQILGQQRYNKTQSLALISIAYAISNPEQQINIYGRANRMRLTVRQFCATLNIDPDQLKINFY